MAHTSSTRRRVARGLAVTLAAATLTGALALPASALTSKMYDTQAQCLAAQRTSSGSFVRITRSCYAVIPNLGGVWKVQDPPKYQFDYVARTR